MRRETKHALHETKAEQVPLEERIARARTHARADLHIVEPTLPTAPPQQVPVVTLTTDQLHDLVYAASSTYLKGLSGMGLDRARHHASRIAAQADLLLHAEHDVTMGSAP